MSIQCQGAEELHDKNADHTYHPAVLYKCLHVFDQHSRISGNHHIKVCGEGKDQLLLLNEMGENNEGED